MGERDDRGNAVDGKSYVTFGFNFVDDWLKGFFIVDKKFSSGNRFKVHVYHDVVNHRFAAVMIMMMASLGLMS